MKKKTLKKILILLVTFYLIISFVSYAFALDGGYFSGGRIGHYNWTSPFGAWWWGFC